MFYVDYVESIGLGRILILGYRALKIKIKHNKAIYFLEGTQIYVKNSSWIIAGQKLLA